MSEQMTIGTDLGTYDAAEVLRSEEVRRMSAELERLEARICDMNRELAEAKRWRRWKQDAEDEMEEMEGDLRRAKVQRDKLEARIAAVLALLGDTGCYCECECHPDEHGDDCGRCLGCRVEAILNPPGKP